MPDEKTKREVRKALARAECFWGIICGADITRNLAGKIGDKVEFPKLSNSEKMTLVKVSTLLMQGANEIEKEFAQSEESQNGQTEESGQAQTQIDINENSDQEKSEETAQAKPEESAEDEDNPPVIEGEIVNETEKAT